MSETDKPLHEVVAELAGVIGSERFPKGDLAELRRMRPENPPPAYWRVLFARVPERRRIGPRMERAWGVVMSGMAIMAPHNHSPKIPLGQAMARIGGPTIESRLWKLLRSREEQLEDQVLLAARYFASRDVRVDWTGVARLLFATDEAKGDAVRRELARSFYRTQTAETAA